jgi:hypothetical protein
MPVVLTQNIECLVKLRFLSYLNLSCSDSIFFVASSDIYLPDFKINKRRAVTMVHFYVSDIVTVTKFTAEKCSRRNVVAFLTFLLK